MTPTPWHFWIVTAIGLVWHLVGVLDYTATQVEWAPWMALVGPRQEVFIDAMPVWVDAAWAISAWLGLLGVLLMAMRAAYTALVLAVSMLATWVVAIWLTLVSDPPLAAVAGWPALATIWGAALFTLLLWLYARAQHRRGVIS